MIKMMLGLDRNPGHITILELAGLEGANLGRFRDCGCELKDGEPIVVIRNRNGGNNRGCCYNDPSVACQCGGCVITYAAERFPTYLEDWDDDYDNTYAYISFRVLPEHKASVLAILEAQTIPE